MLNNAYNPNLNVNVNHPASAQSDFPAPAAVYHAHSRRWTKRFRLDAFQWIKSHWLATLADMEKPNRRSLANAWRVSVVAWLRRQHLIRFSSTTNVLPLST